MTHFLRKTLGVCVATMMLAVGAARAQTSRHLVCTLAQQQGQHRDWVEQVTGAWLESSPDGRGTKFTVTERKSTLHGVSGETLIDPGRSKVFIPDAGVTGPYAKMMYFIDLSGDTGEWQVLGFFTEKP